MKPKRKVYPPFQISKQNYPRLNDILGEFNITFYVPDRQSLTNFNFTILVYFHFIIFNIIIVLLIQCFLL